MATTSAPPTDRSVVHERSDRSLYDPTHDFQGQMVYRSDTPETMLTDYPFRPVPDISIKCDHCKMFISLVSLKEHRLYHNALTILKYGNEEPKNSDVLLKRRNAVLRKMKAAATKDNPITSQQVEVVNDAYEYLKSLLDGKYEEYRQVREDIDATVGGIGLNCSPECVYAVGMASSANERWKSYMEDTRTYQDCFGQDKHKAFYGLYDGYHGRFAAEVAASELHKLLLSEMMKFDPRTKSVIGPNTSSDVDISHYKFDRPNTTTSERVMLYDESVGIIQNILNVCEGKYNDLIKKLDEKSDTGGDDTIDSQRKKKRREKSPFEKKMENAFCKAYYLLDILLSYGKDENSKIRWSGCSAATCVIQDINGEQVVKGKTDDDDDNESVASRDGTFDPPKTIGMIHLANAGNTHAILVRGNKAYGLTKDHTPNNKKERTRVLRDGGTLSDSTKECCVNGVVLTTRGLGNHGDQKLKKCVLVEPYTTSVPIDQYAQFLVFATRGVWEVFSENEAASLLLRLLPSNHIPPPSNISSTLKPLLEQMNRDHTFLEPNSRRVSFSSIGSPGRIKSADLEKSRQGRQRSATLMSVDEQSEKSDDGQRSGKNSSDPKPNGNSEVAKQPEGQRSALNSAKSSLMDEVKSRDVQHSTPTGSSKLDSSGKSHKRSGKLIDQDMQTEIGSHQGDDYSDDSGNEGDVDTYLENISFPGSVSRISMIDGPPSREAIQRNQAKYMAEYLVQASLLAGAKDNVSAMVVLLPGSKM